MSLVAYARRNPSAILLVVQLLGVLVYSAMEGSRPGRVAFELLGIVPITSWGRSVVMLEQLAGLGYVAMVVSRLVGLTITKRRT